MAKAGAEINQQLAALVDRIERLEEDKQEVGREIREVYTEAKGNGYDVKILRKVVALRKQDRDKRREEDELLDLYMNALGMLADTPLGRSAVQRSFGGLGRPAPLTDLERQMGVTSAFVDKAGMRSTMSVG